MEKIMALFTYITEKDTFGEIYRNQLAKRLLNAKSTGNDAERQIISKLKSKCGAQVRACTRTSVAGQGGVWVAGVEVRVWAARLSLRPLPPSLGMPV